MPPNLLVAIEKAVVVALIGEESIVGCLFLGENELVLDSYEVFRDVVR